MTNERKAIMMRSKGALGVALVGLFGLVFGLQTTIQSAEMQQGADDARRVIRPENYPYFGFPYSPGILVGNTLYIAGHLGRDPDTTELVEGGLESETRQAMANINEVLREAGMEFDDVVSVTAYLANIEDFPRFNAVYREFFPDDPPARATVQVAALNVGAQVEIQMIAVKP